jgi:hypothetical protein
VIVGVMQPYFLPYFEHFRLIAACDRWVIFDIAQFTRKSWMTRNRIVNREKGTAYISVPVKHTGLDTPIHAAALDNDQDWRGKLLGRLRVYSAEAPHYKEVLALLQEVLQGEFDTVSSLNTALLRRICAYLEIATPIVVCSELAIDFPDDCGPGEWACHVSKALGATEYRNPSGGRALFDQEFYKRNGLALSFHEHRPQQYVTGSFDFVPDLSIVDWMMWNDKASLQSWLA